LFCLVFAAISEALNYDRVFSVPSISAVYSFDFRASLALQSQRFGRFQQSLEFYTGFCEPVNKLEPLCSSLIAPCICRAVISEARDYSTLNIELKRGFIFLRSARV
jgi:hypothetical protein